MRLDLTDVEFLERLESMLREKKGTPLSDTIVYDFRLTGEGRQLILDLIEMAKANARILTSGDYEEAFRLMTLQPGHVLTERDVQDVQCFLKQAEDDSESAIEAYMQTRRQILHEIGGDELVTASEIMAEERFENAAQTALEKFYKRRAEERDKKMKNAN